MEDESNNSGMETALDDASAVDRIAALLDDNIEASDVSEQAVENVEDEPTAEDDDAVETPDTEETYFDIDGQNVSLSEIRASYLRQADYTRKTQELAEQRKAYQEAQFDKNQLRMEALQGIEALKQQMAIEFRQTQQPNWDELLRDDPHQFLIEQQNWARKEAAVKQMYDAEQALRTKQAEYEAEMHQAQLRESQTQFLAKYPEMQDKSKSAEALGQITQLLIDNGFTKEEIEGVSDYRIVGILYELNKAINAQKAIPQVVQKMEQKPAISVKGTSSKASDAYTKDFNKFNKSRKGDDAIALISRLL
ncbi:hypothetical protein [Neorhizobium sp. NCHU2750]|uniref:hypothetical protein n=1 Tax=Neorhizobium sp. NCHU2750 TaxID=1825976 RepID=UPI000EB6B51A|nr:hypothetical protein NCHU2750_15310 [Neorhizobium sp. NCHU2750]